MQRKNISGVEPRELFVNGFVKQCKKWVNKGDGILMIGDVNDCAISGSLTERLKEEVELEEFTQPFWTGKPPASHINGDKFIVLGMKSKNIEITQWLLLPWMESVGDHRTWIVEITLRSMPGPNLMKVQRSIACRLVTTNYKALRNNNIIVKRMYGEHGIVSKLKNLIEMSDKYQGEPPDWLANKIKKIH